MHLAFILHKFNEFSFTMRIPTTIVIFTTNATLYDTFIANTPCYVTQQHISSNLKYPRRMEETFEKIISHKLIIHELLSSLYTFPPRQTVSM